MARSLTRFVRLLLSSGALTIACSASAPPDDTLGAGTGHQDGGSTLTLPNQEICGNGRDDDGDGLIDEDCNCQPGERSGSGEIPSVGGCNTTADASSGCTPDAATEISCDDGRDNDCDGTLDCEDPDCRSPGQCGCAPIETQCSDGQDDDCDGVVDCADEDCPKCVPGASRYCDEPVYCAWGMQTCGPDGRWGNCIEVPAPQGCEGFFGFDGFYDEECCVAQGLCCQAYPADNSVGNCNGVAVCP